MPASAPTIVATSMGFSSRRRGPLDVRPGPVFELMAELAQAGDAPRICYLNQAVGDQPTSLTLFHGAFAGTPFRASHLALFPMPNVDDIRAHLLAQDVIWVGGGSVANLCAVWRVHGLPDILHECWQAGVVLGGVSAGSICWHLGGATDSYGPELRPFTDGLGWLPYGNGVHYDSEEQRRPLMHRLVAEGTLPTSHCTDDGVGLVYRGTELVEAVADREGVAAYEVTRAPDGTARETRIEPRLLAARSG
ncbi:MULTISPECIES: peptidase E [Micromonospora]|uniref:Peptidase E n=1 Tax=Micromonospora solifontis TaxID=2487138 RepID=A0ABX9WL29_9ACTN|nr:MULTISPECIES: peptidase E [Micromonospora]NES15318.1 peptidase E [Micromonospora sp. PPF5-17B]NES36109.1 peptidase E [Micromonospora solifontis]NES56666.1 peptidase E [Micromonospora sp. PPF5-6]RNL99867.1 peptidase E [Micromonospora solifontis]